LAGWADLTSSIGDRVQIVATTSSSPNPERLEEGIERASPTRCCLGEPIGTLTETLDAVALANHSGYRTMMSHRSGETEGHHGSPTWRWPSAAGRSRRPRPPRGERVAKYNQLLRIEEELGDAARYAGDLAFPRFALDVK